MRANELKVHVNIKASSKYDDFYYDNSLRLQMRCDTQWMWNVVAYAAGRGLIRRNCRR